MSSINYKLKKWDSYKSTVVPVWAKEVADRIVCYNLFFPEVAWVWDATNECYMLRMNITLQDEDCRKQALMTGKHGSLKHRSLWSTEILSCFLWKRTMRIHLHFLI